MVVVFEIEDMAAGESVGALVTFAVPLVIRRSGGQQTGGNEWIGLVGTLYHEHRGAGSLGHDSRPVVDDPARVGAAIHRTVDVVMEATSLPRPGFNGLNMGGELVAVLGEQRCSAWQHEIEAARQPVAAVDEPDANRRIGFVGRIGVLVIAATGSWPLLVGLAPGASSRPLPELPELVPPLPAALLFGSGGDDGGIGGSADMVVLTGSIPQGVTPALMASIFTVVTGCAAIVSASTS